MKPNEGRKKRWLSIIPMGFEHNLLHGSLVRSRLSYPFRQLLCPTATTTSTKFIQHSIYIHSIAIKNKAIIEKLMIIQRKKEKKKAKFLSKEYRWLVTRSFDLDSTRKKDLLQARWAGHTTDQVGLWFVHLSTPRGGDFTRYFCPGVRELHWFSHSCWVNVPAMPGKGGGSNDWCISCSGCELYYYWLCPLILIIDSIHKGVSLFFSYTNMNKMNSLRYVKEHPKSSNFLQFESHSSKSFRFKRFVWK